jgi:hypothetical protein
MSGFRTAGQYFYIQSSNGYVLDVAGASEKVGVFLFEYARFQTLIMLVF